MVEMQNLAERIEKIGKQMSEQAKLSQRLATEKVRDKEVIVEKLSHRNEIDLPENYMIRLVSNYLPLR